MHLLCHGRPMRILYAQARMNAIMRIYARMKHWLRCRIDSRAKREYLDGKGWYRNMAGGWCNSHGAPVLTRREYLNTTLSELKGGS